MYRFPKLLVFVLLPTALACSQTPTIASEIMPTPTFTPWVAGIQTAQAVETQAAHPTLPPPTLTPPAVSETPSDFSPVLYGGKVYDSTFFLLLGGVSNGEWLAPEASVARYSGEATYSLHNMAYAAKYLLWGQAPHYSVTCKTYSIGTEVELDESGFVATLDGWTVTKRAMTELAADGKFYQQAVTDWLATQGVDEPELGDLRIFRVDLEGDGSDEIFISATHLDESQHMTRAGDYSVVLMRKVMGNEVVTELVIGDVYDSQNDELTYPRTYSLANFVDLNQDGILEVVVAFQKWEGFGASVHQVDGWEVRQVLGAGC